MLGTWRKHVDAYVALSEFQRETMAEAGLPRDRIHVKPNFFAGQANPIPWIQRGDYAVFVGRLGPEKGLATLLDAWRLWGEDAPLLRIVGDGPMRRDLESAGGRSRVLFHGALSPGNARQLIADSRLLILPSETFEGFPMVLCEAFAFGTPVLVSNLGPLPSIVRNGECGETFDAGSAMSLFLSARRLWGDQQRLAQLSLRARTEYENQYNPLVNFVRLKEIYQAAIEHRKAEVISR
jgi:glycosyltransferase involved in cell wall biosynthesis